MEGERKMDYDLFMNKIRIAIQKELGEGYTIMLRQVQKNNGILLDGLCISCISDENEKLVPVIYLKPYYEQYKDGKSIEDIISEIVYAYHNTKRPPNVGVNNLSNYSYIKDKIAFKLINAESNKKRLNNIPHISWLDLAIVFYVLLEKNENGIITAMIENQHLDIWKISIEDLKDIAFINTPKINPPVISGIDSIISDLFPGEVIDAGYESPFLILTNTSGINGAACMIYPNIIKKFAEEIGKNIFILPSSINEVLLLPDDGNMVPDELNKLVKHVNMTEVPKEDRLSNKVYVYSRSAQTITLASKTET